MKQTSLPGFENSGTSNDFYDNTRIVYYLGSKYRILPQVINKISRVAKKGSGVCDLFSGSGSVAVELSKSYNIVTVDIQEYSRVLCSALLNSPAVKDPVSWKLIRNKALESNFRKNLIESLSELLEIERDAIKLAKKGDPSKIVELTRLSPLFSITDEKDGQNDYLRTVQKNSKRKLYEVGLEVGSDTVITRYYGGVYFSWQQAIDLDALLKIIFEYDVAVRDHLLAAAFGAASAAVNTIGKHFAQPIQLLSSSGQLKKNLLPQTIRDRTIDIFDVFSEWQLRLERMKRHVGAFKTVRSDYRDALKNQDIKFDAVYADPPYTRDHYSRFYHILETIALHDEPEVTTTSIRSLNQKKLSNGLYRSGRHQSPFSIISQASKAFEDLAQLVEARNVPMVLSYSPFNSHNGSRPRLLTIDKVVEILQMHFSKVEIEPINGFSHSKLNRRDRNIALDGFSEVLLTCTP